MAAAWCHQWLGAGTVLWCCFSRGWWQVVCRPLIQSMCVSSGSYLSRTATQASDWARRHTGVLGMVGGTPGNSGLLDARCALQLPCSRWGGCKLGCCAHAPHTWHIGRVHSSKGGWIRRMCTPAGALGITRYGSNGARVCRHVWYTDGCAEHRVAPAALVAAPVTLRWGCTSTRCHSCNSSSSSCRSMSACN